MTHLRSSPRSARPGASRLLLPLIAAALVGCGDGTAPEPTLDVRAAVEAMDHMLAIAGSTDYARRSLKAADSYFGVDAAASSSLAAATPGPPEAAIAEEHLGLTFVWDTEAGAYVDGAEAGAPADGIRIVYYAFDELGREPRQPLERLGHVDVRNTVEGRLSRVELVVRSEEDGDETAVAELTIDNIRILSQSGFEGELGAVGWISDGSDRLEVDFLETVLLGQHSFEATQDLSLRLVGHDTGVTYRSLQTPDDRGRSRLEAQGAVTAGGVRTALELTAEGQEVGGTVRHEQLELAAVGGTLAEPEFSGFEGEDLDEEILSDLEQLWGRFERLFGLARGLYDIGH